MHMADHWATALRPLRGNGPRAAALLHFVVTICLLLLRFYRLDDSLQIFFIFGLRHLGGCCFERRVARIIVAAGGGFVWNLNLISVFWNVQGVAIWVAVCTESIMYGFS